MSSDQYDVINIFCNDAELNALFVELEDLQGQT